MRTISLFFTSSLLLLGLNVFANTYVVCGRSVTPDLDVEGFELAISSQGGDDYNGPVSTNWDLVLDDINEGWMAYTNSITAQKKQEGSLTVVEIQMINGRSVTGNVGFLYKVIGLYEDRPRLEKYNMGGFTGQLMIDNKFECASSND